MPKDGTSAIIDLPMGSLEVSLAKSEERFRTTLQRLLGGVTDVGVMLLFEVLHGVDSTDV